MHVNVRFLDYFFVLRPTLFFPVWTVFLANYHANLVFETRVSDPGVLNNPLLTGFLTTMLMGSAFILNQLADIVSDRENDKLFIVARGHISRSSAISEATILLSLAILMAFYIDYKLGLIFMVTYVITGIFYNFKPFAWKNKPVLGVFANFLGGLSVSAMGWIAAGAMTWKFAFYALPYAFGLVSVYFLTTLADIKGDRVADKYTFAVKYGFRKSILYAFIFEMIAISCALGTHDRVIMVSAIAAFPFYVLTFITGKLNHALLTIKLSVLITTLAVCYIYPWYLVLIFITYYLSKWYYKTRFNIQYPRFVA